MNPVFNTPVTRSRLVDGWVITVLPPNTNTVVFPSWGDWIDVADFQSIALAVKNLGANPIETFWVQLGFDPYPPAPGAVEVQKTSNAFLQSLNSNDLVEVFVQTNFATAIYCWADSLLGSTIQVAMMGR